MPRYAELVIRVAEDTSDECWIWDGAKNDKGYGQLRKDGVAQYVHRLSYELFRGPIPEGLTIDHLCRTRLCFNPRHLEAVTMRVNLLRGTGPIPENAAKTHCVNGHEFTEENTYRRKDVRGRQCKTCCRIRYYARKAAA